MYSVVFAAQTGAVRFSLGQEKPTSEKPPGGVVKRNLTEGNPPPNSGSGSGTVPPPTLGKVDHSLAEELGLKEDKDGRIIHEGFEGLKKDNEIKEYSVEILKDKRIMVHITNKAGEKKHRIYIGAGKERYLADVSILFEEGYKEAGENEWTRSNDARGKEDKGVAKILKDGRVFYTVEDNKVKQAYIYNPDYYRGKDKYDKDEYGKWINVSALVSDKWGYEEQGDGTWLRLTQEGNHDLATINKEGTVISVIYHSPELKFKKEKRNQLLDIPVSQCFVSYDGSEFKIVPLPEVSDKYVLIPNFGLKSDQGGYAHPDLTGILRHFKHYDNGKLKNYYIFINGTWRLMCQWDKDGSRCKTADEELKSIGATKEKGFEWYTTEKKGIDKLIGPKYYKDDAFTIRKVYVTRKRGGGFLSGYTTCTTFQETFTYGAWSKPEQVGKPTVVYDAAGAMHAVP